MSTNPRDCLKIEEVKDWTDHEEIVSTFPFYVREKFRVEKAKNTTNTVYIEPFTLKTPYGDKVLFNNTKLFLEPNKRTCLFGGNGSGKTSLFEAIVQGKIRDFPTHIHVYHLKELEHQEKEENVLDTVTHANDYLNTLNTIEAKLLELIAAKPDADTLSKLEQEAKFVDLQIKTLDGRTAVKRAIDMLRVLGFDANGLTMNCKELSGGLRMRVALAMAFFVSADLLFLDEPTNHLDFPSVLWLENRLRGYRGSFLLVTHDRDLLENVTTGVILLEDQKMLYYNTNFRNFETTKAKEDAKKELAIDKFLERNRNVDPSTPLGREKHDKSAWSAAYRARLIAIQGKFTFPKADALEAPAGHAAGEPIPLINMQDVRFSYKPEGGIFIFNTPTSLKITTASRLGIMGPNGAGKSTLLKLLTGKLNATEGKIDVHPNFITAYFGQHSTAELKMEMTPSEFMREQFPDDKPGLLKAHLQKAGVVDETQNTRMLNLSFSQRSCVIFAKLTFVCPHLLIMDEPTNFLDLASVDSLINACNKYQGALMVVTHSRGFLRKCATQFVSVVPGKFLEFDNMKAAEAATYTFIQELEAGGKMDANAAMSAGGGAMGSNASAVSGEKAAEIRAAAAKKALEAAGHTDETGFFVVSATDIPTKKKAESKSKAQMDKEAAEEKAAADKAKKAAKAAKKLSEKVEWKEGMDCEAQYSDGKWYKAVVVRATAIGYQINWTEYNEQKFLQPNKVRTIDADRVEQKPAGTGAKNKRPTAKGGAGGAKGGARGAGGRPQQGGQQRQQGRTNAA